jgi:hypothetical protein
MPQQDAYMAVKGKGSLYVTESYIELRKCLLVNGVTSTGGGNSSNAMVNKLCAIYAGASADNHSVSVWIQVAAKKLHKLMFRFFRRW